MTGGFRCKATTESLFFTLFPCPPPAPCPPEDVDPVLDCSTNTARVEWQGRGGADFYIVQALGVEEHESGCETASLSCDLGDLMCGFTYNISVIAINGMCNVSKSDMKQLQAGEDDQRDLTCGGLGSMINVYVTGWDNVIRSAVFLETFRNIFEILGCFCR